MTKKGFGAAMSRPWGEVVALERATIMESWRIRFIDGTGFGFHDYMYGAKNLAAECLLRSHIHIPKEYQDLRDTLLRDGRD